MQAGYFDLPAFHLMAHAFFMLGQAICRFRWSFLAKTCLAQKAADLQSEVCSPPLVLGSSRGLSIHTIAN